MLLDVVLKKKCGGSRGEALGIRPSQTNVFDIHVVFSNKIAK